jgi:hypothetical protein
LAAAAAAAALLWGCVGAADRQADRPAADAIVPTSTNALMVYLIDPTAHEIWDRNYVNDPLTDHEWMLVQQYSNNLAAGAVLLSLGGNGQADQAWVRSPDWRRLTYELQAGAFEALGAVDTRNQDKLNLAGNDILRTCESCHQLFKPDVPTEGLVHIPHGSPSLVR